MTGWQAWAGAAWTIAVLALFLRGLAQAIIG